MLVLRRDRQCWEDRAFRELPSFLGPGDCLALNDSRVFPSRLYGYRKGFGGKVEVFLVRPIAPERREWEALVRPGRKMRVGEVICFGGRLEAEIVSRSGHGQRVLRFFGDSDLYAEFEKLGDVPLPPYLKRPDDPEDRERYQTVFARERGSVAAPTAGLHFTPEMLEACRTSGADIAYVTLHVGLGTFQPLHEEQLTSGRLHPETYSIGSESRERIRAAQRLIAVGTTSVRTIETAALTGRECGETELLIAPGFEFRRTGALLTNFHLPRSSLLLLAAAFAGRDLVMRAYEHAVSSRYRFYSYGDCMLIL